MSRKKLAVVDRAPFVPANLSGLSLADAAVAWFNAGFEAHPARTDGAMIDTPRYHSLTTGAEVYSAFERLHTVPGIRLGVSVPRSIMVLKVRPLTVPDRGGNRLETWKESIDRIWRKLDPGNVLHKCPCHRISGQTGAYLWLTTPGKIDLAQVWGPENTMVFLEGSFVLVPPGGSASLNTRASWIGGRGSERWEIPTCPEPLFTSILSCVRDGEDEDLGV